MPRKRATSLAMKSLRASPAAAGVPRKPFRNVPRVEATPSTSTHCPARAVPAAPVMIAGINGPRRPLIRFSRVISRRNQTRASWGLRLGHAPGPQSFGCGALPAKHRDTIVEVAVWRLGKEPAAKCVLAHLLAEVVLRKQGQPRLERDELFSAGSAPPKRSLTVFSGGLPCVLDLLYLNSIPKTWRLLEGILAEV